MAPCRVRLCSAGLIVAVAVLLGACGGGGDSDAPSGSPRPSGAQADDPVLLQGRDVYTEHCARCHGVSGGGGIGPQLADGRVTARFPDIEDQLDVVRDGRNAMPAFGSTLSEDEIDAVVRYSREVL